MEIISISEIVIPDGFFEHPPKQEKIDAAVEYLNDHGKLDKPIVLTKHCNTIIDNYTRLVAAQSAGLESVPVVRVFSSAKYQKRLGWPMQYVVGVFEYGDILYTWKNPKKIPIKVGEKVLVRVRKSNAHMDEDVPVTVVDTYYSESKNLLHHKNVVGIWY